MNQFNGKSIVFFDGVCNFCNSSVNFIIEHDHKEQFLFSPLQSEFATDFLKNFNIPEETDSILLYQDETIFDRSTAALKIAREIKGLAKYVYYFIYIPRSIRDFIYQIIAKNRYRWFGRKTKCMVPSGKLRKRFIF